MPGMTMGTEWGLCGHAGCWAGAACLPFHAEIRRQEEIHKKKYMKANLEPPSRKCNMCIFRHPDITNNM